LVNGDTVSTVTLNSAGAVATAGVAGSPYSIVPSAAVGTGLDNYAIIYAPGTLTVNALAVWLTGSRLYDGTATAAASILSVANLVGSDVVTVASGSATLAGADAGVQAIASVGTLALSGPAAGNYTLVGAGGSVTITISGSSLALGSSANPSLAGSNLTFTATVTPDAAASTLPAGDVQFYINGVASGSPVPLSAGVASLSTTSLPVGTDVIVAVFAGDNNFLGSSNSLAQVVQVVPGTPNAISVRNNGDGTVTITFAGTPDAEYVVQSCDDLAAPTWANVSTNTAGPDGHWTFTESNDGHSIRFYRVAKP
jgi:hypothetical protein